MSSPWPPTYLTPVATDIINELELLEMRPQTGKEFVPVVHMAALLVVGEYAHARHLWRRSKGLIVASTAEDQANHGGNLLMDWWTVGKAMMESDASTIWQGLTHIQTTHPATINHYATEVAAAYRVRVLQRHPHVGPGSVPYWALLNFGTAEEMKLFCQEHRGELATGQNHTLSMGNKAPGQATLTQVVAFLENRNVVAPPVAQKVKG